MSALSLKAVMRPCGPEFDPTPTAFAVLAGRRIACGSPLPLGPVASAPGRSRCSCQRRPQPLGFMPRSRIHSLNARETPDRAVRGFLLSVTDAAPGGLLLALGLAHRRKWPRASANRRGPAKTLGGLSTMKRKPSPATVISLVALFFSVTGASIAASHYLITSVSQIKPSVRHALRGERGRVGRAGIQGATGLRGAQGQTGAQGAAGVIDWDHTYKVFGSVIDLQASGTYAAVATCSRTSDRMITGGYIGTNEIVTQSEMRPRGQRLFPTPLLQPIPDSWVVSAQLIPGESAGSIQAWALCAN